MGFGVCSLRLRDWDNGITFRISGSEFRVRAPGLGLVWGVGISV